MAPRAWLIVVFAMAAAAQERVVFDTDSGFFGDDGQALVLLARSPEKVRIEGVTVVSGNVWARPGIGYMRHILELLEHPDIRVYLGAQMPLVHSPEMMKAEDRLGFTGAFAEPFSSANEKPTAIDFLVDTIDRNPGRVTVLALGPMTNIAIALRLRPDLETKIRRIVFMGGNLRVPGNASPAAEFNFWFDPEAAQAVLRSRIPEKIMFGLDICDKAPVTRREFDRIVAVDTPITRLYREDIGNRYPGFLKNPKAAGYMWDTLAAAWLLDPGFVTRSETLYLDVTTAFGPRYGATVELDRRLAPSATPVRMMTDLNVPRVFALVERLLTLR